MTRLAAGMRNVLEIRGRGKMKAAGIDIGTTTISAVVLDTGKQQVIKAKTIANGSFIHTENEWERIQDVSVIMEKAKAVLDEMLDEHADVETIGLTCQMHGILYLDAKGKCLSPLYTWQDGRGNLLMNAACAGKACKDGEFSEAEYRTAETGEKTDGDLMKKAAPVSGETYAAYASRISGRNAASGYGLVTHFYHERNHLVPEGSASLCTVGDYLGMLLTGRKSPLSHATNAASFGFFDVKEGKFDLDALAALGIDTSILPEVTEEFAVLGTYRNRPVTVALGDNQASFLGSVGIRNSVLLVNMGTGGQISVLSDKFFEAPGIEARPFVKGKYLLAGASLCGGRAYAILEKFLRAYAVAAGAEEEPQYAVMEALARKEAERRGRWTEENAAGDKCGKTVSCREPGENTNGMKVATLFNGTRVNPLLRGSITNISEDNFTPEGLVYGVLDGMAQELYDMFCLIQDGIGVEAKHLIASGNGLRRNEILRGIFSEKFGADVTLALYEEEAACGVAVGSAMTGRQLTDTDRF